jgi:hypothetical protein
MPPRLNEIQLLLRIAEAVESGTNTPPTIGTISYSNPDYSGAIIQANTPQDLCSANPSRDRVTLQNISTGRIILNVDANAVPGVSFVIEPGGIVVLEQGEADKRISIASATAGLAFVAKGRIASAIL